MNSKFQLVDAMNTYNPALNLIREKGFELSVQCSGEAIGDYFAENNDCKFAARDPLALLGLITIWELRGKDWRRASDEDIDDELITNACGDD